VCFSAVTACPTAAHRHLRGSAPSEQTAVLRLRPFTTLPGDAPRDSPRLLQQISRSGLRSTQPRRAPGARHLEAPLALREDDVERLDVAVHDAGGVQRLRVGRGRSNALARPLNYLSC